MERWFDALTHALEAAPGSLPWLPLGAAFARGMLSLVLSPCHLAGIPLIVGFVSGRSRPALGRVFATAALFALGILVTLRGVGVLTAGAGRWRHVCGAWFWGSPWARVRLLEWRGCWGWCRVFQARSRCGPWRCWVLAAPVTAL